MLLMSDVYSKWMIFSRDGVYPITEALPINNAQNKTHHQHQDCFQITSSERVVSTEVPGPMAARWGERMLVNKTRSSTWLLFCPLKWVISILSVAWLWLDCGLTVTGWWLWSAPWSDTNWAPALSSEPVSQPGLGPSVRGIFKLQENINQ